MTAPMTAAPCSVLTGDALATDLAFSIDEAAGILDDVIPHMEDVISRLCSGSRERLTETVAWLRDLAEKVDPR